MKKNSTLNSIFPIWEKVYLEVTPSSFWENIQCVQIKQLVYVFSSIYIEKNKNYYIIDLENESIKQEEIDYAGCFYPVWDKNSIIYLFRFDDSSYSDYRYHIVEFNIEAKTWSSVQYKGVPPKRRSDDFTAFFHPGSQKVFFFGGLQIYPGDNTGAFIYSFYIRENEWNIESYTGAFPSEFPSSPYLSNRSSFGSILFHPDKLLLIGGKFLESNFNLSLSNGQNSSVQLGSNLKSFFNEVESDEVYEFDLTSLKISKKQYTKLLDDVKFVNCSSCQIRDNIYIHNKGCFYSYDLMMNELSMLKPLLFNPKAVKDSSLVYYNNYLYIIGRFKHFEDCAVFKTSVDNLLPKWNCMKEISYEMLLNNKDCSDIVFVLNAGDKNREIHLNKKVMYNFSLPLKNIIINYSQNSNYYNFNDVSFIGVYNTLKFIYSNFNDNISSYDIQIIQEMIDIIVRYRAKSLLNIALAHIKLTNENALSFYELAVKFSLNDFLNQTYNYIGENINSGLFSKEKNVTESMELKKLLFENFFCAHPITIQVNTLGFDVKSVSSTAVSQEKFAEIKDLCKNNKIFFCLSCKKIINN